MTAAEKRKKVINKYRTIIGRNKYSQAKRTYCFKKASDGKYYSDCSSSTALSYKECGFPIRDKSGYTCPNTVGMYQSPDLVDVPVKIKNGIIQNPSILRQGDLLLFAGKDNSRKAVDCVGHVEMVANITSSKITLFGHGSGTPRETEMNAYCRSRYNSKVSTVVGHRGLLKVRRLIQDDVSTDDKTIETEFINGAKVVVKDGMNVHVRIGPSADYKSLAVCKGGTEFKLINTEGWIPVKSIYVVLWVSSIYAKLTEDGLVLITGGTVNMRSGPGKNYPPIKVAKRNETYVHANPNGWYSIEHGGIACWVTSRYTNKVV